MTPDLAAVVDSGPVLPGAILAGILAMVKAASAGTIPSIGESVSPRGGGLFHERTYTVGLSPLPSPRNHIRRRCDLESRYAAHLVRNRSDTNFGPWSDRLTRLIKNRPCPSPLIVQVWAGSSSTLQTDLLQPASVATAGKAIAASNSREKSDLLVRVGLVGASVFIGFGLFLWQARRATRAEAQAKAERNQALAIEAEARGKLERALAAEAKTKEERDER